MINAFLAETAVVAAAYAPFAADRVIAGSGYLMVEDGATVFVEATDGSGVDVPVPGGSGIFLHNVTVSSIRIRGAVGGERVFFVGNTFAG